MANRAFFFNLAIGIMLQRGVQSGNRVLPANQAMIQALPANRETFFESGSVSQSRNCHNQELDANRAIESQSGNRMKSM